MTKQNSPIRRRKICSTTLSNRFLHALVDRLVWHLNMIPGAQIVMSCSYTDPQVGEVIMKGNKDNMNGQRLWKISKSFHPLMIKYIYDLKTACLPWECSFFHFLHLSRSISCLFVSAIVLDGVRPKVVLNSDSEYS